MPVCWAAVTMAPTRRWLHGRDRPGEPTSTGEETPMAIGPVQLLVLGFNHPNFHGEVMVAHLSNLTLDEAVELGSKVGALIGLGIEGEEGLEKGAEAGAEAAVDGVDVFSATQAWDVLEDIPDDSAAALVLIEHHWAVPLRDAIA